MFSVGYLGTNTVEHSTIPYRDTPCPLGSPAENYMMVVSDGMCNCGVLTPILRDRAGGGEDGLAESFEEGQIALHASRVSTASSFLTIRRCSGAGR